MTCYSMCDIMRTPFVFIEARVCIVQYTLDGYLRLLAVTSQKLTMNITTHLCALNSYTLLCKSCSIV